MENNLHNIDEIFAKTLGDHSIDPSGSVWDKIQGQLDASTSSHQVDKVFEKGLGQHTMEPPAYVWDNIKISLDLAIGRRRRIIGWITGAASAVVIAFVGGYFIANSGENASENVISEKISNTHQVQIDINHFWDMRNVVFGQTTSGGQTYTSNTPNNGNNDPMNIGQDNVNHNSNTNNGYINKNIEDNHNGYFGTHSQQDFDDKRNTPNIIMNDQHKSNSPAESQDKGGDDKGKKGKAVTTDVNGPVENQIGTNGSTSVAALNNNEQVIIENSTNNTVIVTDNNTNNSVEENRTEAINPNEQSSIKDNQDENGNPLTVKEDVTTTFTVLPYFSPTYTFRNSSMTSTNGIQNAFGTETKFKEQANFSYSAGLLVGYNFTPRLTIFIGASFNSFSNTTSRNDIHSKSFDQIAAGDSTTFAITTAGELGGVNIVPTQGTPENPTYIEQDYFVGSSQIGSVKRITQTFSYVEVPVMARYKFFGPKIGLILTGGLSTGFIVQNDVTLESDTETKKFGGTSQIRNFNMNAIFGIGIEARLMPFMYLNIEPTFKYSFLNWSMDNRFQMNPISLGLNTGLAFKF